MSFSVDEPTEDKVEAAALLPAVMIVCPNCRCEQPHSEFISQMHTKLVLCRHCDWLREV